MIDEIKQLLKKKKNLLFKRVTKMSKLCSPTFCWQFSFDGSVFFLVYKVARFELYRVGLDLIVRTRENRMRNFWSIPPAAYDARYRRAEIFFLQRLSGQTARRSLVLTEHAFDAGKSNAD